MKPRKARISLAAAVATALTCGTAAAGTSGMDFPDARKVAMSVQAIDGSGRNAIDGSGRNAIDGSGLNAIDGSGRNAIDGSGLNAIDGSGRNAIDGSGRNAIDGSGLQAIDGSGLASRSVGAFAELVIGPVERISDSGSVVTILGQDVHILDNTSFSDKVGSSLTVGDYVAVSGVAYEEGIFASTITIQTDRYVSGSSPVRVSGLISEVNSEIGQVRIGEIWIDISASKVNTAKLSVGQYLELEGIQPLAEGRVLAN